MQWFQISEQSETINIFCQTQQWPTQEIHNQFYNELSYRQNRNFKMYELSFPPKAATFTNIKMYSMWIQTEVLHWIMSHPTLHKALHHKRLPLCSRKQEQKTTCFTFQIQDLVNSLFHLHKLINVIAAMILNLFI